MKSIKKQIIYSTLFTLLFVIGCTKDAEVGIQPEISGLEDEYIAVVNKELELKPTVTKAADARYSWILNGVEESTAPTYTFKAPSVAGRHTLVFRVEVSTGMAQKTITIEVGKFSPVTATVNRELVLELPESFKGVKNLEWKVTKASSNLYRLSNTDTETPSFIAVHSGKYRVKVIARGVRSRTGGVLEHEYLIHVQINENVSEEGPQTPYIAKVFDYLPAPGQFVNSFPRYVEGDTQESMNAKVAENLVGENSTMITLGGWGGYVTFGFDHTIVNVPGLCDFCILGNAFGANANPRPNASFGGSCEPGIIMVAYDKNKNGEPDEDEWYEIKGSGNFSAENEPWYQVMAVKNDVRTFRDYEMTYYRPESEEATEENTPPDASSFTLIQDYIKWTDNKGQEGYKIKNKFHHQSYYPGWINEDKITYKGIRLSDNGVDESEGGTGSDYVLYAFRWGYADNFPNGDDRSAIDIDWAIDKNGHPVDLPGIDFVRVYNGVDKENGWLGEASTEVAGAHDLHMLGKSIKTIEID